MLQVALVAAVCFLVGGVNPATLVARMLGIDLRTAGSGNPGAANAGRVLGRKWGALVLALDVLKAYLPTLVVLRTMGMVPALVAGLAVVLGHVFSPFLGGKGGKGVAAALGAMLAIAPWVAVGAVLFFALATVALPFIGEASVVTTTGLLVVGVLGALGVLPQERAVGVWLVLLSLLVLSRHRRNILAWWVRRIR
ncbi:MAG: glycerol-3-phosphate acyltransferase [Ornithinibacter sp.]